MTAELLKNKGQKEWIRLYPQSFPSIEDLEVDGVLTCITVRVSGTEEARKQLDKVHSKDCAGFMGDYDLYSDEGRVWDEIVYDLSRYGIVELSPWKLKEFLHALEDFAGVIGDEFDLDLEYQQ